MQPRSGLFWMCTAALLAGPVGAALLRADEKPASLEAWMPENVVACARIAGLRERVDAFLASDARRDLESIEIVRRGMAQEAWKKFEAVLAEFRASTGKEPLAVLGDLLGKEVLAALRFQLSGPEVIVLARGAGEKEIGAALDAIRQAAEKRLGRPLAREESTRGEKVIESFEGGKLHIARMGDVLALSSSRAGVEAVLDLAAGKSQGSIAASPALRSAVDTLRKDAFITALLRPKFLPNMSVPEKANEPLGSLLLGGLSSAINGSELVGASLAVGAGSIELSTSVYSAPSGGPGGENQAEGTGAKSGGILAVFFPAPGKSEGLPARLRERGALAAINLRRDLARWWEAREDIMTPRAAGDLLQFANFASVIFGGRSFQDEVIPAFGTDILLVARNQTYAGLKEKPRPSIPGFAAVFELKSAGELGNSLAAAFQSLIGIINLDRAQKKKEEGMSMLLRTEKVGTVDLHTVSLAAKSGPPGIGHNFTPSLAVAGTKVILSSSSELAKLILEEIEGGSSAAEAATDRPPEAAGDSLSIDAAAVGTILKANHEFLISDNMVKKGNSKEEAEAEIGVLYSIVDRLRELRLGSWREGDAVRLRLRVDTRWAAPRPPSGGEGRGESSKDRRTVESSAPKKGVRL